MCYAGAETGPPGRAAARPAVEGHQACFDRAFNQYVAALFLFLNLLLSCHGDLNVAGAI